MSDSLKTHPAASLPASLRFEYAAVIVSMVYADNKAERRELTMVNRLCEALALSPESRSSVHAAMKAPNFAMVETALRRLGAIGDLRFSLLTDALVFAFADGRLTSSESSEVLAFADALGFTRDQVMAIARWVEKTLGHGRRRGKKGERSLAETLEPALEELRGDPKSAEAAMRWLRDVLGADEE